VRPLRRRRPMIMPLVSWPWSTWPTFGTTVCLSSSRVHSTTPVLVRQTNFLLPKIVSHFRRKAQKIELGNLNVWRDFSDVRALVSAYRGLIEAKPLGQTINVSSGQTHSLGRSLKCAKGLPGTIIGVEVNPAFVRANEVKTLCGDILQIAGAGARLGQPLPWTKP
jgi:nucleoside-diphosphate-sugar epimerase